MQLGLGTYAYAWAIGVSGYPPKRPMPLLQFLDKASRYEFDCVQIADNLPLHLLTERELTSLKEEADELGLDVEVGMRGLLETMVIKYLEIAERLGSPFVRLVIDTRDYEPELPEIIKIFRKLIPVLKDKNIRLAIENHDRFLAHTFVEIINETDPDWIGICLDSVNSLGAGQGFYEVADILLPYTINIHIKDYFIRRVDHNMGFEIGGTIAGKGMLPIRWLLEETKKYSRCHSAILELWPPPEKEIEATIRKEELWVEESAKYLRELIR